MADIDERLIDKRVQERNMRRGLLDKKELEKHLKDLPDVSDKGEVVTLSLPEQDRE
jgi:hypothetical protein